MKVVEYLSKMSKEITDDTLLKKIRSYLSDLVEQGKVVIDFDDDRPLIIPSDPSVSILGRSYFDPREDIGFVPIKVYVAFGKYSVENGFVNAAHGLAAFYFDEELNIITSDFARHWLEW